MSVPGPRNEIVVPSGIVVWIDVDEVLLNFCRKFNQELIRLGYEVPVDYVPIDYDYCEIVGPGAFPGIFEGMDPKWVGELDGFPGAAEFTRRLKELGCRVVLITSIHGFQMPDRIHNLRQHKIYYDELYPSRGRKKSEFARVLLPRYVDPRGKPCRHIIIDDTMKNTLEFVDNVPRAVKGITLNVPYNRLELERHGDDARINSEATTQRGMFEATLRCVVRLLSRRLK
jgi:hypothetical protein